MQLSDVLGLLGSLLILMAPAKDQYQRWKIARAEIRGTKSSSFRDVYKGIAKTYNKKRISYSAVDFLTMAIGAILLAASFIV